MGAEAEQVASLVKLADDLVYAKKQRYLSCLQKELLQGILSGLKYKEIQANKTNELHHYPVEYLGCYVAYELWKLLTEVLHSLDVLSAGEKVTKNNVRAYLQRVIKQQREPAVSQVVIQNLNIEGAPTASISRSDYPINKQSIIQPGFNKINWVGREALIAEISQKLLKKCRILSVVGITGIGKTALAGRLTIEAEIAESFPLVTLVDFNSALANFDSVARSILGEQNAMDSELLQSPEKLVAAVVGKLKTQPFLLVLDMVEEILEVDSNGVHQFKESIFFQFLERVIKTDVMLSRIIITSQDKLPILAEGRYPALTETIQLTGLTETEAFALFNCWDIKVKANPNNISEASLLRRIINVYEGHPLALTVIVGEIQETPYCGDIQAYWYDYGQEIEAIESLKNSSDESCREDKPRLDRYSINLAELVKTRVEKTFSRLLKSSPLAYLMLCMGAKYRRAVERRAWLMLIDECHDEDSLIAFQVLQKRFLLEKEYTPGKVLYRLHSLIRRVALDNLSKIEDEVLPP
jgi:hypothetical protein